MTQLRLVTLAGDPEREAVLAVALGSLPDVELFMRVVERAELLAVIRARSVDGIVSVGVPSWLDRQCFDEAALADIPIVGLPRDPLEADQLEVGGSITLPIDVDAAGVVGAFGPATSEDQPAPQGRRGRIVSVWGPKGAPGRSTIAVETAFALASPTNETLLADGDPYGGDLRQMLGVVDDAPSVIWMAAEVAAHGFDEERAARELRRLGPDGPVLLPGLPRADLWDDVSDYGWRRLLAGARDRFDAVVVDTGFCLEADPSPLSERGEGRNRMARIAISESDQVVAVCRADPLGLRNFLGAFSEIRGLIDDDQVIVVANQVRAGTETDVARLLETQIGKRAAVLVPYVPNDTAAALSRSRSLRETRPGSPLVRAVEDLASALGGQPRRRGLLTRLAGRV